MVRGAIICMILAACAACGSDMSAPANEGSAVNETSVAPTNETLQEIAPGQPGGLPDDRNLVEEGPIDPKSPQGAGQVLQSYAALLEQGRYAEARRLWSDGGKASGATEQQFADSFAKYSEVHAEIGAPGSMEGAGGSAYVDIPVRFYGKIRSGAPFSSTGTATLRRVNDVPGSTEEQRQWRIYRIEAQPPL